MLAQTQSAAPYGLSSKLISIECDISNGLPGFIMVGLGDKAINEARERLRSAIRNSGLKVPAKRITFNLGPADLRKDGSGFDLAMAAALLAATGQIMPSAISHCLLLGELALDGSIRPVKDVLSAAKLCRQMSYKALILPAENAEEACLISDLAIIPVKHLQELYYHLAGIETIKPIVPTSPKPTATPVSITDLADIQGNELPKRAIEIAAAGGHHLILSGTPGTGKTMLAKAVLGILPPLSPAEQLEVTQVHSAAGMMTGGLIKRRPFRAPHHTISLNGMIGGGTKVHPGEISLSHHGVLLLDELPEFQRPVLEALRQPLEDNQISLSRNNNYFTYPARFMLVATCNPCPCGYSGDPEIACTCSSVKIYNYQRKLSGPLLDRIDLIINVDRLDYKLGTHPIESSAAVAQRVKAARDLQIKRFDSKITNAQMSEKDIANYCKLNNNTRLLGQQALKQLALSPRAYSRTLKVARTIADLAMSETIQSQHLIEALQYRPQLTRASYIPQAQAAYAQKHTKPPAQVVSKPVLSSPDDVNHEPHNQNPARAPWMPQPQLPLMAEPATTIQLQPLESAQHA